jgi:hypothetical protein
VASHAQPSNPNSKAQWQQARLSVVVNEQPWLFTIPFKALSQSQSDQARFSKSTVTADENFRPEGSSRVARAVYKDQVWLLWGSGKAPVAFDSQGAWPYRLVRLVDPQSNAAQLVWVDAAVTHKVVAKPDQVQTIKVGKVAWCTWVASVGELEQRPGVADGSAPTVSWMLWRRPAKAACR